MSYGEGPGLGERGDPVSAYANDPRVTEMGAGYTFKVDMSERGYDKPGQVWMRNNGIWVGSRDFGSYPEYATADEAIRSLIGNPR